VGVEAVMTHQEIKELAGHRAVSPWVMKLVNDAVMKEREACAKICDDELKQWGIFDSDVGDVSKAIRARNKHD
jgi:hypothetical protein